MAENKLPSGVGKKIVAALKKQSEVDVQAVSDAMDNGQSVIKNAIDNVETNVFSEPETITDNIELNDELNNEFTLEEPEVAFDPFEEETAEPEESFTSEFVSTSFDFEDATANVFDEKEIFKPSQQSAPQMQQKSYAVPANVAVLKRLIMQLPEGVSKQTGAQIIRQTMEALGISMKSVLKEAQQGQDSITASAKACLATIAEYKNNIRGLEKQVQDYKKQAIALNDLISLFVMTDK